MDTITYSIKKSSRAKRLILSVKNDGSVVLTVPKGVPSVLGKQFVKNNTNWIKNQLQKQKVSKTRVGSGSREEYLQNKESARKLVHEKLDFFNNLYGYKYNKISIKNTRTRWGSCSKKGNLNFSYKIVFLRKELQDYLIVHELCHLKELNHSKKFWDLVAKTVPDYKKLRKELKNID